jgi:hypothetical protein
MLNVCLRNIIRVIEGEVGSTWRTRRGDKKCIHLRSENKTLLRVLCEDGRRILN